MSNPVDIIDEFYRKLQECVEDHAYTSDYSLYALTDDELDEVYKEMKEVYSGHKPRD